MKERLHRRLCKIDTFPANVTLLCIPLIVTRTPWKHRPERVVEEVDGPGDDNVVVHTHDPRDDHHSVAHPYNSHGMLVHSSHIYLYNNSFVYTSGNCKPL